MKRSFLFSALLGLAASVGFVFSGPTAEAVSGSKSAAIAAPSASTTIVISQAYGGGGGASGTYVFDYVELKNISSTPKSLNGLSLMYGSATGQFGSSTSNVFALPDVTLQPGQFYLVQLSSAGSGGTAFPVSADVITTNLSMSGTNGKVALVNGLAANSCGATATPCTLPNAQIIDLVAWGSANNAEGGAPTNGGAALVATQGNVRKAAGCTDTDNNNADFDVVTDPAPKNMSSSFTACPAGAVNDAPVDMNSDGKTDWVVVRNSGGQYVWYVFFNGGNPQPTTNWGTTGDRFAPADFDGDHKDDIAVFRPSNATWYILESATSTIRIDQFGVTGDDPSVIGDYNGDGKDDLAVYREGAQSFWYYKTAPNALFVAVDWGQTGDFPAPGDYDGDGKNDFVIQRADGGEGAFYKNLSSAGQSFEKFGAASDLVIPGDYDGDGKTDLATAREEGAAIVWRYEPSGTAGSSVVSETWGLAASDFTAQGDYNGDGRTDFAVWRNTTGVFYVLTSGSRNIFTQSWGQTGDLPVARYNAH
jgi:hypothetical protein